MMDKIIFDKVKKAEDKKKNLCYYICTIDGKDYSIPLDAANRHYKAVQEWIAEGKKIEDAD